MEKINKVGIVCCSNGLSYTMMPKIEKLVDTFKQIGITPVLSTCIYQKEGVASGTARERAAALMDFYKDEEIEAIFDISGGDIANDILPYIDYEVVAKSGKAFWGYSDLTTILNAIYAKTNQKGVLYQVRNLIYDYSEVQLERFKNSYLEGKDDLFAIDYNFVQGEKLEGIVVGGNIRCLLKLAGTSYWPDMTDKVLLLEARGGSIPQMTTFLAQLQQLGVFEQVRGIILGTFTELEEAYGGQTIVDLVKQYTDSLMPIVKTQEIGHGTNSKAIQIGVRIN